MQPPPPDPHAVDGPRLYDAQARAFRLAVRNSDGLLELETADFSIVQRDALASLTSRRSGIAVNHHPVADGDEIMHRSLIVTPLRRAFIFLSEADFGLSTTEDAEQWILGMLQRRAGEISTRGVDPDAVPVPVLPDSLPLQPGRTVVGRDPQAAALVLPGLLVSRTHAAVDWDGSFKATITDLRSFNGTFVNGDRVRTQHPLRIGDRVDIGATSLVYAGDRFSVRSTGAAIELAVHGVTFEVPGPDGPRRLLDEITLAIRPGEFVVIIGPSGCGKSLLIKMLGARLSPSAGAVYVNRGDLTHEFDALKRTIGYVPQRDVLHEPLRLTQALDYSARLRLSADLSASDRQQRIAALISELQLKKQLETRVARLSGGQSRRASLANEMLPQPGLLLLDEVTSGLDEETDGDLMRMFRRFADEGKTVVCVTHNLYRVAETAHRVVVLAPGGRLAYFGFPEGALKFFQVERLGEIYPLLRDDPASCRLRYAQSEDCRRHVTRRMPLLLTAPSTGRRRRKLSPLLALRAFARDSYLLTLRTAAVKLAQPQWLALLLLQCIGLALLIGWLFGDVTRLELSAAEQRTLHESPQVLLQDELARLPPLLRTPVEQRLQSATDPALAAWRDQKRGTMTLRLLISLVMCAMWLGCNNASSEVVRERSIFEAERETGVGVCAYLLAKILVLGAMSSLQIVLLVLLVRWWTALPGTPGLQLALLCSVGLVGGLLGLAISAWSQTGEVSTALVPIAVIPQILLAGTLVPLSGLGQKLAEAVVPLHWGYRGLVSQLMQQQVFSPTTVDLLRMVGAVQDYPATDAVRAWQVLGLHAVLLAGIAYIGLKAADPWPRMLRWLQR